MNCSGHSVAYAGFGAAPDHLLPWRRTPQCTPCASGTCERRVVAHTGAWGVPPGPQNAAELQLTDSKTGGRTVPLSPSAVRLLASLPREDDNPWVIVGRKRGAHLTDLEYPWRRIRARAGLHDVRIHDLRHSFASRALALGEGLPMIGKLLGHTQVQTTARYAHLARDTMKVSAARIGDSIDCDLDADGEVAERPAA